MKLTEPYSHGRLKTLPVTIQITLLAVVAFHVFFSGTHRQSNYLLAVIPLLLSTFSETNASITPPAIPKDVRTPLQWLDINPQVTAYLCCPECCALYGSQEKDQLVTCTYPCEGDTACGAEMFNAQDSRPIQTFEYQSIPIWWGRMLCRPGIEEAADTYARQSRESADSRDIWESPRLRRMRFGPQENTACSTKCPEVGRYVFELGIDWFHADEAKPGKKTRSVGAIYVACLNLPPHLRFLPENICVVGIIPGPNKPHGAQLNHFMEKVGDDFVQLRDGVWYSQTHMYPNGREVYGLLGPVVADLDACRAVGGCTGHNHRLFCSICRLPKDSITDFNYRCWPKRTFDEHKTHANRWKAATSQKERDDIRDTTGVFWTPLLRLGYWDPTQDLVVDIMHNLLLGWAETHCRKIWKMDYSVPGGDGDAIDCKAPSQVEMTAGWTALRSFGSIAKELGALPVHVVKALCYECGLMKDMAPRPVKETMINQLIAWVSEDFIVMRFALMTIY